MHSEYILHVRHTLLTKSLNLWSSSRRVTRCGMSERPTPCPACTFSGLLLQDKRPNIQQSCLSTFLSDSSSCLTFHCISSWIMLCLFPIFSSCLSTYSSIALACCDDGDITDQTLAALKKAQTSRNPYCHWPTSSGRASGGNSTVNR